MQNYLLALKILFVAVLFKEQSSQKAAAVIPKFVLRAMGASYRNGFGFEMPIPSGNIASVKGSVLKNGIVNFNKWYRGRTNKHCYHGF